MRGLKLLSSASLIFLCTVTTGQAMNMSLPDNVVPTSYIHKIGWDQKNLQAQTQGTVYLRAQIEELKKQNEQLRNVVSQLKHDKKNTRTVTQGVEYETRMKALIEENKRLSDMLYNKKLAAQQTKSTNADAYALEIHRLKERNEELQQKILTLSSIKNVSANASVTQELDTYKKENESLRRALVNKKALNENADRNDNKELEQRISSLQKENRGLALALADATNQALEYKQKAGSFMEENKAHSNNALVQDLQSKVQMMAAQNDTLQKEIKTIKTTSKNQKNYVNSEVLALKKQNQSLRETIKAQSKTLISTSNASQTAERMISENLLLKRKLEQAGKSSDSNGETAKQLFEDNKDLRAKMASYEETMTSLRDEKESLKDQISVAKAELQQMQGAYYNKQKDKAGVRDINNSLQQALEKERATTIAYRTKIREYQNEISRLNNEDANSEYIEQIDELTKENNILKEEVDKLSKQASSRADSVVYAKMDKVTKDDVTYVDSPYPPVEKTLPILDQDGNHINYAEGTTNIAAEDLLSQDLKALSEN